MDSVPELTCNLHEHWLIYWIDACSGAHLSGIQFTCTSGIHALYFYITNCKWYPETRFSIKCRTLASLIHFMYFHNKVNWDIMHCIGGQLLTVSDIQFTFTCTCTSPTKDSLVLLDVWIEFGKEIVDFTGVDLAATSKGAEISNH